MAVTVGQIMRMVNNFFETGYLEKDYAIIGTFTADTITGTCVYCNHCQPCPAGIDIGLVNKYYDLATMQPEVPASVKAHYRDLEHTAAECIGCGGCEERCPFQVPIRKNMAKAVKLFGY